ncbi:nicotinate-nucleotide--dimethylbenzimidazole phosphoribosyltransferase [Aquamicrobium sp. LC103]|uniref:nicotinate-nucleotide--dimethylbenzimidazole phosphoribosyltransferase n=1 Tax=Aquamicrobium sp. LC103 TaxID=1120658 RepID=UPI00063EC8B9|nr:nicotinate-nucleotide--dimethylbenzimidazole phosphoribosyltransferase [Aquamicrobium sp. LC103]TKT79159.1 nicotinate-nucleotide--dimethylbenzimidazole phosphoribosyltransferase [Aquamicrobium sp. LC103]
MTSGLPFDDFRDLLKNLPGPDKAASARAAERNARLSAQGVELGRIAGISEWLAAWSGRAPQVARPLVALFAGTHEVARHGVSPRQISDTQSLVEFCAAGGAAINQLCAANDLGLKVFDLALHLPVADITREAALDERGCAATMAYGMEAIAGGADLICAGSIGVGGSTVAAALMHGLFGGEAREWVGPGSGAEEAMMTRKAEIVARAVALHSAHLKDPLEALRRLGGREFAAIAGAILAARMQKIPVILDGYTGLAAAAVLHQADETAIEHCLLGHVSTEPGMRKAAEILGLKPLLDFSLGDGEGVGAALAAGLVKNAAAVHSGMTIRT